MNSNQKNLKTQNQPKKIDLNHYVQLLMEKKYWIILITVFMTILWLLIAPSLISNKQMYEVSSLIRFEDPRVSGNATGIDDRYATMEIESKLSIIRTTMFLQKVIDSLALNISVKNTSLNRGEIFKNISIDSNLVFGKYEIIKKNKQLQLFYTNKSEGKENLLIGETQINSARTYEFYINGFHLVGYTNFFTNEKKLTFVVTPNQFIIENLKKNIIPHMNRARTLLTLTYKHHDPELGAEIINTVSELLIKQSLEFKQSRTKTVMNALEEQLAVSKKELQDIEEQLKNFRERNPHIYLSENIAQTNRDITDTQIELNQGNKTIDDLTNLLNEVSSEKQQDQKDLVYAELLQFLEQQNVAGARAIDEQYSSLISSRRTLLNEGYSEEHPRIIELNSNIREQQKKIRERAQSLLADIDSKKTVLKKDINSMEYQLRQSPSKEMTLAKLQRDRETKANIYSNILLRYNEVKLAHTSITPDAYLIERAVPPIIYSDFKDEIKRLIKKYLIGPFLGLFMSIGFIIVTDFIWHRGRSIDDIENTLSLPVLASIPLIKEPNTDNNLLEVGKKLDPKLITVDYTPNLSADSFRNLRTRLILDRNEGEAQQCLVTSLLPGDGKSLVASNLAVTFAQLKRPTLIIDCDLRRGVQHNTFVVKKKPGLADFLAKSKSVNIENITTIIQKTTIPNLNIISSGNNVPNPSELIVGENIHLLLDILNKRYQYIIIDTPPIEFITDALILNKYIRNLLIVTRYAKTDINALRKKLNEFQGINNDIAGVVLNAANEVLQKKYQSYSYYKY